MMLATYSSFAPNASAYVALSWNDFLPSYTQEESNTANLASTRQVLYFVVEVFP